MKNWYLFVKWPNLLGHPVLIETDPNHSRSLKEMNTNLNVNDEGFVNWWEKFWNAMEAVCVKSVDGLFGVGGNLRWPWPLIWALTWLVLWFMVGCWVPLPTPSFPNKLGWLKLEK